MVVIAIIAILAAVLIPSFLHARAEGDYTACKQNISTLARSFEMYAVDYGGRMPPSQFSLMPLYLKALPTCPSSQRIYDTQVSANNAYTFLCNGQNHTGVGVGVNYPQYLSGSGLNGQ